MQFYVTKHSFISSKHASTSIKQRQRDASSSCSQVWAISLRYTLFPVVLCCSLTYFSISSDFFRLSFFSAFICYVSTLRDSTLGKLDRRHLETVVTLLSLWLHSRPFYSTRKTLHTEFTKNGLTETYFCNKKQNESNMAEGVFLNSGMQRLTISEGLRAFEG
jgi:hypothetical protein